MDWARQRCDQYFRHDTCINFESSANESRDRRSCCVRDSQFQRFHEWRMSILILNSMLSPTPRKFTQFFFLLFVTFLLIVVFHFLSFEIDANYAYGCSVGDVWRTIYFAIWPRVGHSQCGSADLINPFTHRVLKWWATCALAHPFMHSFIAQMKTTTTTTW